MSETPPESKRRRWLKREAIDLGDVAVQIIAVVMGILLALFINDWVTQRQQQANVDEAMRAIRGELAANRKELLRHAGYLSDMANRMENSPANMNQQPRICPMWKEWTGTEVVVLTDAAYQTSIATQALANMPFAQAQLVSRIYGFQRLMQKLTDREYGLLLNFHPQPLGDCVGNVREIAQAERELSSFYGHLIGPDAAKPPTSAAGAPQPTTPPAPPSRSRNSP